MGLRQVDQGFFHFLRRWETLKSHEICKKKKSQKNEEKPCSTCLKPIIRLIPSTRKSDFGYTIRHYIHYYIQYNCNDL